MRRMIRMAMMTLRTRMAQKRDRLPPQFTPVYPVYPARSQIGLECNLSSYDGPKGGQTLPIRGLLLFFEHMRWSWRSK